MDYRIYRNDNYIFIDEETPGTRRFSGLCSVVSVDNDPADSDTFIMRGIRSFSETLDLSQIKKEDGTAYTSTEFIDFYTQNTGESPDSGSGGGAVTVTSSALPTGASTSANQTTGNNSLASIDTKTPTVGQKTMAESSPVVIASDQSAIPVTMADASASGTITTQNLVPSGTATAGSAVLLTNLNGTNQLAIQITGTYTGALSIQASTDNVTWVTLGTTGVPLQTFNYIVQSTPIGSAQTGFYKINISGFKNVRVTALAAVTGTATVQLTASRAVGTIGLDGPIPQGTNAIGSVTVTSTTPGVAATSLGKAEDAAHTTGDTGVALWGVRQDALSVPTSASGDYGYMALSQYGSSIVKNEFTHARTYSASARFTIQAAANDVFLIPGNATTTVYITKIVVSGIAATGRLQDVAIIKRSTANTGGTSATTSVVLHDSNDSINSTTPISYTANPTPGTTVGAVRRAFAAFGTAASTDDNVLMFDFASNGRPLTVRGIAQSVAVNLADTATIATDVLNISVEWFEIP